MSAYLALIGLGICVLAGGIVPNADKAGKPRIGEFIRSHEWTEFHQARVGKSGTYFRALCDDSEKYVMVEFYCP